LPRHPAHAGRRAAADGHPEPPLPRDRREAGDRGAIRDRLRRDLRGRPRSARRVRRGRARRALSRRRPLDPARPRLPAQPRHALRRLSRGRPRPARLLADAVTRRAVLFLQLGGPETLDDVPGFLYRLFSDPDVIRVRPALLRRGIAAAIALGRAKASRALYASIGGGSPIRRLTESQAAGTESLLVSAGRPAAVRAAMTCSAPLVEDVVRDLASGGVDRFLAFPLYPQY